MVAPVHKQSNLKKKNPREEGTDNTVLLGLKERGKLSEVTVAGSVASLSHRIGLPAKNHRGQLMCQDQESRANQVGISELTLLQTPDSSFWAMASLVQADVEDGAMK